MNADEARGLGAAMKRWGIAGVVAPEDPATPDGEWRVYDSRDPQTRRDVTEDTLAALAQLEGTAPGSARRPGSGPTRGFVIPQSG
jgi:hypothetical protein